MLHRNVTLDIFAINPSAVISADVPHGMAVPAPPVVQFFGTLSPHMEGYAVAMLARQVKLEWSWQIGNAALHKAVRHLRSWLIESEVTKKRIPELCSIFFPREFPDHGLTFDAGLHYLIHLALPLTSEFKQAPS